MRRWIAGTVLVCAALAVATLPPEAPAFVFGESRGDATPERLRANELRREVFVAQEALVRRHSTDSLTALTRGAADRAELLVVGAPRDVPDLPRMDAELIGLGEDARAELIALGITRPAVDLGIFVLRSEGGMPPRTVPLVSTGNAVEWYTGEAAGRPYCIVARLQLNVDGRLIRGRDWTPYGAGGILGPCGFYARHGMPGTGIQRWMQSAGASLAQSRRGAITQSRRGAILDGYLPIMLPPEQAPFFRMRSGYAGSGARVEACLKRSTTSCGPLMTESAARPNDEIDAIEPRLVELGIPLLENDQLRATSWGDLLTSTMLDDLERAFGAEAFGRFWSSSQPVTAAFQDAFGTSVDAWVLEWARSLDGADANLKVAPAAPETLLMVLYALIGLGLAVVVGARRRLG